MTDRCINALKNCFWDSSETCPNPTQASTRAAAISSGSRVWAVMRCRLGQSLCDHDHSLLCTTSFNANKHDWTSHASCNCSISDSTAERYQQNRGWTTSDFLKSAFMWWKLSRSRLVADDVINEQISLELWQTPCAHLWHTAKHGYCSYNSLFLSVLSSLGRYISHRFLLVLNQIQISSTVKIIFIWTH